MTMPSAYFIMVHLSNPLWHIFLYKIKNTGDRTQPWREPVEEQTWSDRHPLTLNFLCSGGQEVKGPAHNIPTQANLFQKPFCQDVGLHCAEGGREINK